MANIDRVGGPSAKEQDKEEKGNLKVKVVDQCHPNDSIKEAEVSVASRKNLTGDSGEVEFSDLKIGGYAIRARKAYPECNYFNFIIHYPSLTRSDEAEATENVLAEVENGKTTNIEIKLKVYRKVIEVIFKRNHIRLGGGDKYGHWWVGIDGTESYGWWPAEPLAPDPGNPPQPPTEPPPESGVAAQIQYMADRAWYGAQRAWYLFKTSRVYQLSGALAKTFKSVKGDLNGQALFGGTSTRDPHHHDPGEERYQPIVHDCRSDGDIKTCIRNFARSYAQTYGDEWSWRGIPKLIETGNNCHSFQIKMINHCDLEDLKEV